MGRLIVDMKEVLADGDPSVGHRKTYSCLGRSQSMIIAYPNKASISSLVIALDQIMTDYVNHLQAQDIPSRQ